MGKLDGKVALVTGGAQSIGRAVVLELAGAGADVGIADINLEGARAVAEEARVMGRRALALEMNVSDPENVKTAVDALGEELGPVDILVNNAGITRDNLLMRMKREEWEAVLAVNLSGVFNCTQAVVRSMMKRRSGSVVNIASVVGQMGNPGQANYCASKAGVVGLTKSAARELGSRNIRVNAVAPGFIETPMTESLTPEQRERLMANLALRRLGQPEDVAKAVLFLASDDSSYITGHVVNINGGMYM